MFARSVFWARSVLAVCRHSSSCSVLPWSEVLPYRSVRIDLASAWRSGWRLPADVEFGPLLTSHFDQWRREKRSGVWLHLPLPLVHLANEAVEVGFTLHHASQESQSVVLCAWLEEGPSRLPHYASHQVGVSGVVFREDKGQVLVVQDKFKWVKWKFPGGLAEPSEDIAEAAQREVREETGVETEFRSVLAFRQHHQMPHAFGLSDLYFICRLHPLTFDLQPCEKEVVKCDWMSIHELATSQESTLLTQRIARLLLDNQHNNFQGVDIAMETMKDLKYKLFIR